MAKTTTAVATNKPPKAASKEVAVKASKEQLLANMQTAFEAEAGAGFENVTARDLLVPRLVLLQSLSPQIIKSKPEFIKGAKSGDICDTATKGLWDEVSVVPVYFDKKWLEWKPRSAGGGLVKIHDNESILDQCTKDDKGKWRTKGGNDIIDTLQFYVLNLSANGQRSFISMSSTQIKKGRGWITASTRERAKRADGTEFQPPFYYRAYTLTPKEESNAQGAWFSWNIEPGARLLELPNGPAILAEARAFREGLIGGAIKIREDQMADQQAGSADDEEDM